MPQMPIRSPLRSDLRPVNNWLLSLVPLRLPRSSITYWSPSALDLGMIAADSPGILKDVPEFAGRVSAEKATLPQLEHPLAARPRCSHQHGHIRKTPITPRSLPLPRPLL